MHAGRYGVIDLRKLTVEQAEKLISKGFTLLRMKEKETDSDEKKEPIEA